MKGVDRQFQWVKNGFWFCLRPYISTNRKSKGGTVQSKHLKESMSVSSQHTKLYRNGVSIYLLRLSFNVFSPVF